MADAAHYIKGTKLTSLSGVKPVGATAKRLVDIALASFGIVLLCPLLLFCFAACLWPIALMTREIWRLCNIWGFESLKQLDR